MSVTLQILNFTEESKQLTPPEAARSEARKLAAREYRENLRGLPMVDDGSLYPVLDRYRARLVEIDERYNLGLEL